MRGSHGNSLKGIEKMISISFGAFLWSWNIEIN